MRLESCRPQIRCKITEVTKFFTFCFLQHFILSTGMSKITRILLLVLVYKMYKTSAKSMNKALNERNTVDLRLHVKCHYDAVSLKFYTLFPIFLCLFRTPKNNRQPANMVTAPYEATLQSVWGIGNASCPSCREGLPFSEE